MDYPQLNLLFGLLLILALVVNIGLRIVLFRVHLPVGWSLLSGVTMIVSILASSYIEILFLRFMTPAFNRQLVLGLLIIVAIGILVTASLYRRISQRLASTLLVVQILAGLFSLILAFGLYRSMVPM